MSQWPHVPLREVLLYRKEFIEINDVETYKRCRVQLHAQGIVLRDQVSGAEVKTKQQQVCRAGEFLVAEIDAKLGGYGIVPSDLEGAIVSSHYFLFGFDENKLDRSFLGYFIQTPAFFEQVAAQGSTNYAAIRPAHVLDYTMPLPPLTEQRRLVERIDAVAARIEEAKRLRQVLGDETSALTTASRRRVFTDLNADAVELNDVCTAIIDCLHSNPVYADDGIPTVRSPDVGWGSLMLNTARKTGEAEYRRRTVRGEPSVGDIVVVREGGGTGKAGIVEEGHRFSLGQRVMMLRLDRDKIEPKYLLYQWLSPLLYEDQIMSRMKGSASPHLNIGAAKKFQIRLPPLDRQRQVVAYLDELKKKADEIGRLQGAASDELQAIMPAILDRAFRGELD
jgi:type I restriction enzyme S subunit